MEFFVNLGDWPLVKLNTNPLPILSWCGSDDTLDIVMPTYDLTESTLETMGRYVHQRSFIKRCGEKGRQRKRRGIEKMIYPSWGTFRRLQILIYPFEKHLFNVDCKELGEMLFTCFWRWLTHWHVEIFCQNAFLDILSLDISYILAPMYSKRYLQHDTMPFFPTVTCFITVLLWPAQKSKFCDFGQESDLHVTSLTELQNYLCSAMEEHILMGRTGWLI